MPAKMPVAFQGVLVPLLTPLTRSGSVDREALKRLLEFVLAAGVHGVFPCGSTGEGPNLTEEMWNAVVETTAETVAGHVPVFVGCIDTSSARVIQKAKVLRQYGADYAVVTPPFYFAPSEQGEIMNHYKTVAHASPVPVYAYNIPQLTNCHIDPDTAEQLAEVENIAGLKDSSGNFPDFCQIQSRLRGRTDFGLLQGNENLIGPSLLMGATGSVPGSANIDPHLHVELFEAAMRANIFVTNRLQFTLIELRRELLVAPSFMSSLKAAGSILGLLEPTMTTPETELPSSKLQDIRRALVKYGVMRQAKELLK